MAKYVTGLMERDRILKVSKPVVSAAVNRFMRKQAAMAARKESMQDTGELDMDRLAYNKTSDDIFQSHKLKPEGKNHGVIFLMDWSASMAYNNRMAAMVNQITVFAEFARKTGIAFEVYAFSSTLRAFEHLYLKRGRDNKNVPVFGTIENQEARANPYSVALLQILSSDMPKKEYMEMLGILHYTKNNSYTNVLGKGGTPLNNALMMSPTIIRKFQKKYNTERTLFSVLTDGADCSAYSIVRDMFPDEGEDEKEDGLLNKAMEFQIVDKKSGESAMIYGYDDDKKTGVREYVTTARLMDYIGRATGVRTALMHLEDVLFHASNIYRTYMMYVNHSDLFVDNMYQRIIWTSKDKLKESIEKYASAKEIKHLENSVKRCAPPRSDASTVIVFDKPELHRLQSKPMNGNAGAYGADKTYLLSATRLFNSFRSKLEKPITRTTLKNIHTEQDRKRAMDTINNAANAREGMFKIAETFVDQLA